MRPADNPFRSECLQSIPYIFPNGDWDILLNHLQSCGNRGAIVGACGTGKSTLLIQMEERFKEKKHQTIRLFLNDRNRREAGTHLHHFFKKMTQEKVVFLDGAEQLNPWQWWWFLFQSRHTSGLIVTCHHEKHLPWVFKTSSTPPLLSEIINQLLKDEKIRINIDHELLYKKHHGNIREALREMYDIYSTM